MSRSGYSDDCENIAMWRGLGARAGTHQIGWFDRIKPTMGKTAAMATPPEFRDELLALAKHAIASSTK